MVAATVLALGLGLVPTTSASAAGSVGISGTIQEKGSHKKLGSIRVELYDASWSSVRVLTTPASGRYSFSGLASGTYHLKFIDKRKVWDLSSHAYAEITSTLRHGTTTRNVSLAVGASITGVVRTPSGVAKKATVIAVNQYGGVYQAQADAKGRFAIGGLTGAKYSVFYYDAAKRYTGGSSWIGALKIGANANITKTLSKKAGSVRLTLVGGGKRLTDLTSVTVVNAKTGQWWVANVRHGVATIRGLAAGTYSLTVNASGRYLGQSFSKAFRIHSGGTTRHTATLTKAGGVVATRVVDASSPATPLAGVAVTLYSQYGAQLATAKTDASGSVVVGGTIPDQKVTVVLQAYSSIGGVAYGRVEIRDVALKAGAVTSLTSSGVVELPRS